MIELRQNTEQAIIVGPFLDKTTNRVPTATITLSGLTYRKWIRQDWTIIELNGRTWVPLTGANGFYLILLTAVDLNFTGHGTLYFYNSLTMSSPAVVTCNVLSQNFWDAKYSNSLLKTELMAQKA